MPGIDIGKLANRYMAQYITVPPTGDLGRMVMACTTRAGWVKCEARAVVNSWNTLYMLWHELEEPEPQCPNSASENQ